MSRRPTVEEAQVIRDAGLNPRDWLVVKTSKRFLVLTDNSIEQREKITISKATGDFVENE